LTRNLQVHRLALGKIVLRPRAISDRLTLGRERTQALAARALRAHGARLAAARRALDALARVMDGISYRAVLERGFALVRGADGSIRRRAETIVSGEKLGLVFADGVVDVQAVGGKRGSEKPPPKKPGGNQGSLF
jgi:exodeoxyribonuclease VII large subunit